MKAAFSAVLLVTAAVAAGCGGTATVVRSQDISPVAVQGPKLSGNVDVVASSKGDVRICPPYASTLVLTYPPQPPTCIGGVRAVGVDTSMLASHVAGRPERWGSLYLVGHYRNGKFFVSSQRLHGPAGQPADSATFDRPPCSTPPRGWRIDGINSRPSDGMRALNHYGKLAHHRDILSIAFFDQGNVLTVATTHPARTRAILGPHWPRQLCVVKSHYATGDLGRARHRVLQVIDTVGSADAARWGWPTGGAGIGVSNGGQPRTSIEVLLETPKLRALVRSLPRGIVVVDAALR